MASSIPLSNRDRTFGKICLAAALVQFAGAALAFGQGGSPNKDGWTEQPAGENRPTADRKGKVLVDENNLVDLAVNDEDLGTVLEMLSIQSQKNIIASKNVSARVTANLYRVSFYEALGAVLHVNGYGWVEKGNFIMVYTTDEINAMAARERVRVSKVIPLNYLSATDAAEFVKPLLSVAGAGSEPGVIKTNNKLGEFPAPGDTPRGGEDYASGSMIVVFDYEENVDAIEALVRQLDTRPAQVLVEATILQTSLNEANALGVDFSIIADASFSEFVGHGGPLAVVNGLISGRTSPTSGSVLPADGGATGVVSGVGGTSGPGGLKIGVVSNDVAVFLRVLDEVTDTTILSNPKILALNRQSARVLVGRKVGYLSTTSTDTATTQTVQFLDTGTQLYFRPTVSNDGMIRMELKPQVSEAVIREQQDATGAAVTIPDEITNELTTNVMVRDGQTIVLGGLFRESTVSGRKQVPLLGDIPIIGYAFRGQDDEIQRNEIIFMVTPRKVDDAVMATQGDRAKDHENRLRAGAREGTLFFSRDKLTSLLNVRAEEEAEKGNTKKALWYARRSLAMNSNQSEAIGLREKLATDKMNWPERSVLERIIDGEKPTVINKAQAPSSDQVNLLATLTNIDEPSFTTAPSQANTVASNPNSNNAAPAWSPDAIAASFYEPAPTTTAFGNVGLFNQFVTIQRNAYLKAMRESQFTTVPEQETPAAEPAVNLHR
ncbi:MAG: hypothetical protein HBSAPP03_20580 [Phycisphaerae bacterium]|nr:MAG: hypothetical protein HBSAPP03_20580 [Phycisphaerae bacterium]